MIKARAKVHSWSLESYPGKVRLPNDIFRPLPGAEAANEVGSTTHTRLLSTECIFHQILKTIYLPEHAVSWLADRHKERKNAHEPKVSMQFIPEISAELCTVTGKASCGTQGEWETKGSFKGKWNDQVRVPSSHIHSYNV